MSAWLCSDLKYISPKNNENTGTRHIRTSQSVTRAFLRHLLVREFMLHLLKSTSAYHVMRLRRRKTLTLKHRLWH